MRPAVITQPNGCVVSKVSRSSLAVVSVRQINLHGVSRRAGAAATGVSAFEFVARREPAPARWELPQRRVGYGCDMSPRGALGRVFCRIKHAATAKLFEHIAERLGSPQMFAAERVELKRNGYMRVRLPYRLAH
jgi:hypothetical protein